mgnify:FL=1
MFSSPLLRGSYRMHHIPFPIQYLELFSSPVLRGGYRIHKCISCKCWEFVLVPSFTGWLSNERFALIFDINSLFSSPVLRGGYRIVLKYAPKSVEMRFSSPILRGSYRIHTPDNHKILYSCSRPLFSGGVIE